MKTGQFSINRYYYTLIIFYKNIKKLFKMIQPTTFVNCDVKKHTVS